MAPLVATANTENRASDQVTECHRGPVEPMIRAVIFDFNGVLVDDESLHFELFREVLAEAGVDLTERNITRDTSASTTAAASRKS